MINKRGLFVELICPQCNEPFQVLYNSRFYVVNNQEGKCPDCRTRTSKTAPRHCMNKYDRDGNPLSFTAPCGRKIVNERDSRCNEYMDCRTADACLNYTAEHLWDGWKVAKGS